MIGWYIGLVGIFVSLVGGIYFIASIVNMQGELKKSIFYLVAASFIYVVFSSMMVVFGLIQYGIEEKWWQLIPVLFTLSPFLFVYGSYKLVKLLKEIRK